MSTLRRRGSPAPPPLPEDVRPTIPILAPQANRVAVGGGHIQVYVKDELVFSMDPEQCERFEKVLAAARQDPRLHE